MLHKRFQLITDVNSDRFNPIPSADCLLDRAFARVLLIPEQALLHAAKLSVITAACVVTVQKIVLELTLSQRRKTAKAQPTSPRTSVSWQVKLQAATTSGALPSARNQETVQGQLNRYILELTEADLRHQKRDQILVAANNYVQMHWTTHSRSTVIAIIASICGENFLSLQSHDSRSRTHKSDGEIARDACFP